MLGNKKKYDVIFGIGEACSCSATLRKASLQIASYPLDWLYGTQFKARVDILCSKFNRFIEKEDLQFHDITRSISCDAYGNSYNNLIFNHDFPMGEKLDDSYPAIKAKYDRRIQRLLSGIDNAQNVLIMYMETPNCAVITSDSEIIEGYQKIKAQYPHKNITLLYWKQDNSYKPRQYKMDTLADDVIKITANYKNQAEDAVPYGIDVRFTSGLLRKYFSLNVSLKYRAKQLLLKLLIKCIPIKSQRKKLRKKYHVG